MLWCKLHEISNDGKGTFILYCPVCRTPMRVRRRPKGVRRCHGSGDVARARAILGPGAYLKKLIAWGNLSPPGGCRGCDAFADQMDAWGPDGCRERMAEILDRLRASANEHGKSFWEPGARLLVTVAIARAAKARAKAGATAATC